MPKYISGTYATTHVLSNPTTDNPATVRSTGLIDVNSTIAGALGLYGGAGTSSIITNFGTVEGIASRAIHPGGGGTVADPGLMFGWFNTVAIDSCSSATRGSPPSARARGLERCR
jgi:hypothetical protein